MPFLGFGPESRMPTGGLSQLPSDWGKAPPSAFVQYKPVNMGRYAMRAGAAGGRMFRSYLGSSMHRHGKSWVKAELGIGMRGWGRWLGRGFIGASAITGYMEGGVGGAIRGVGEHLGMTYALGAARGALGSAAGAIFNPVTLTLGAAALGAAGYIYGHRLRSQVGREHYRKHARLEMGTPAMGAWGRDATMRQRSVTALQNSRLNGMTALGNEAALMYRRYGY